MADDDGLVDRACANYRAERGRTRPDHTTAVVVLDPADLGTPDQCVFAPFDDVRLQSDDTLAVAGTTWIVADADATRPLPEVR